MGSLQGIVVAGLLLAAATPSPDRSAAVHNRDGNNAFAESQYDSAVTEYTEAMTHAPELPDISYNLGNALHKNGAYDKAAAALSRAVQEAKPELQQQALYNLGNTFFRMGKAAEALEAYKRALRLNPNDVDTKINFEKALQLQKQQQEQQQDQNQEQNQQQDPKQKDQQNGQQDQDPESGDQQQQQQQDQGQQQDQQNQDQNQQDQQGKDDQSGQNDKEEPTQDQQPQETGVDSVQAVPEGQMSPEEALRVLQALRDQEEQLQKERARMAKTRARGVEKDW